MRAPCKDCERKGCGAYHDRCPAFMEWTKWNAGIARQRSLESETRGISRDHELKYRQLLKKGINKP